MRVALLLLSLSTAAVPAPTCPPEALERVDGQITSAALALNARKPVWRDLALIHTSLAGCDDGYISEGISDIRCRAFATQWSSIPWADKGLVAFAVRHVDATCAEKDLQAITQNAARCSKRQSGLCQSIAHAAQQAQK
jgi:hypothetical protein